MKLAPQSLAALVCLFFPFLAVADSASCYNIRDPDKRAFCLGSTTKSASHCYNVRDQDLRHLCLALADGQKSHCYNIRSSDLRNQCLASTGK